MKEGVLWYKYILRVSCKRSSACTQSTDAMCIMVQWNSILFRQAVQGVLVPRLTNISLKTTLSSVRLISQENKTNYTSKQ